MYIHMMALCKRFYSSQYFNIMEKTFNKVKQKGSTRPYFYLATSMGTILGTWGIFMKYKSNKDSEIRNIYEKERNL